MVQQQSLENIVEDRKTILKDILPLFAVGTAEQMTTAVDALAKQEDSKYRTMMQELERQCDKYERRVGREFIEPYELTAKDPAEARRYFIVLNYIKPIAEGDDRSRSLAAKRIAAMDPKEYAYAIQTLRSANEHPTGNDEVKRLLWQAAGLGFTPIQPTPQKISRDGGNVVYDPAAARRAQEGREYAFAALHYGNPDIISRRHSKYP